MHYAVGSKLCYYLLYFLPSHLNSIFSPCTFRALYYIHDVGPPVNKHLNVLGWFPCQYSVLCKNDNFLAY